MGSTVLAAVNDSFEEDDVMANATIIGIGEEQVHSIFPPTDQDWLSFALDVESNVTLTTSGTVGDTRLTLFSFNGVQLAENDNNGSSTFSQIVQTALAAGNYFMRIDESGNDAEIAAYTIAFNSNPSYEPNETQSAAKSIPTGSTQALSITPSTDED